MSVTNGLETRRADIARRPLYRRQELDPPYWGCEDDYGKTVFGRDDFGRMAELLGRLKGRFVLSINDVPQVRELFGGFALEPVELNYTITKGAGTPARELIVGG